MMHYTSDSTVTYTSLVSCNYTKPHPRWNVTNDRAAVTCERCQKIARITHA